MFKNDSTITRTSTAVVLPGTMSPTPSSPENTEVSHDDPELAYEGDNKM